MLLLDVPPEVFQRIIEIYVNTVGVRKAAKAREASKTFLLYINEEVFARQPVSKLKAKVPKKLLEKNLVLFLERRLDSQYGVPDLLPSTITRIVDFLVELSGSKTRDENKTWTKKVIAAVAKHGHDILHTALAPTQRKWRGYPRDDTSCLALAVAIILDDIVHINQLLVLGASPWKETNLFGVAAFFLCARLNSTRILRTLLSTQKSPSGRQFIRSRSTIICASIYLALVKEHATVANEMLSWHLQHLGEPSGAWVNDFLESSIVADNLAFVQNMHSSGCLNVRRSLTREIIMGLLENPHPRAMLEFLESKGYINFIDYYRRNDHDEARRLIGLAVHHNHVPLAEAVFALDQFVCVYDTAKSLRAAISQNNLSIVTLFLTHGADPECPGRADRVDFSRSTCELARPGSEVYRAVRKEVRKKMRKLGHDYKPPTFMVWDKRKQMDVPVAYTFQAPKL